MKGGNAGLSTLREVEGPAARPARRNVQRRRCARARFFPRAMVGSLACSGSGTAPSNMTLGAHTDTMICELQEVLRSAQVDLRPFDRDERRPAPGRSNTLDPRNESVYKIEST